MFKRVMPILLALVLAGSVRAAGPFHVGVELDTQYVTDARGAPMGRAYEVTRWAIEAFKIIRLEALPVE